MSKRKSHLRIPVDDGSSSPLDDGFFDLQTHLLHGLIHCNSLVIYSVLMELKEGLGISAAEKSWIFGIESAQISGPKRPK